MVKYSDPKQSCLPQIPDPKNTLASPFNKSKSPVPLGIILSDFFQFANLYGVSSLYEASVWPYRGYRDRQHYNPIAKFDIAYDDDSYQWSDALNSV